MSDHITLELLRQIRAGEREASDLAAAALGHLLEICPNCRRAVEDWRAQAIREEAGRPQNADSAVPPDAPHPLEPLADLMAVTPLEWADKVRLAPGSYASPALAERLLSVIAELLPDHVPRTFEIATLAGLILGHCSATPQNTGLFALSVAYKANALRVKGDLQEAEELLQAAQFVLRPIPPSARDPLIGARIDGLEGSLRRMQRRYDEAEAPHLRSFAAFCRHGTGTQAALSLLSLVAAYGGARSFNKAHLAIRRIQQLIAQENVSTKIRLMVAHTHALTVYQRGHIAEARSIFTKITCLYDDVNIPSQNLRKFWLEGHLLEREGKLDAAEDSFRRARSYFEAMNRPFGVAVLNKHLAALHFMQGRLREGELLINDIISVFEARDVRFEADAARKMLRDALAGRRNVN